jgi:hypothetical protein
MASFAPHSPSRADAANVDTGVWGAPFTPPNAVTAVHMALLNNGKVLMFGEEGTTLIWDPVKNTSVKITNPGPIFCGGHTILADGRVYSAGGRTVGIHGPPITAIFDPATNTWTKGLDMAAGRYYPTTTELANGKVFITGGSDEDAKPNATSELYTPATGAIDIVGNHYDNWYPHDYVLPDTRLAIVSRNEASVINTSTWVRTMLPKPQTRAGQKSGVLLPGGPNGSYRVMIVGGTGAGAVATPTAQVMDFSAASPTWQPLASMPQGRHDMNLVILPDGTLLGVGGYTKGKSDLPQYETLLYDPAMNTWRTMATQSLRRAYHSTAILLPDGRVLSGGDNRPGGGQKKLEIYSPPYLFKGARPTITSATSTVGNNGTITVQTPSAVDRAVLMAPGATTHANDMHQRMVELQFTNTAGGISAHVPTAGVAPPGYYMLFILNATGVPSVASWVKVT